MVEAETHRGGETRDATANALVEDIRARVRMPDNVTPQDALRAVTCTFTLHASGTEARHIFTALPGPIQPLLGRCVRHRQESVRHFERDVFLELVADHLSVSLGEAEDITSAVIVALSVRLPRGEVVDDLANHLPVDLRHLWEARRIAAPVDPHPILTQIERRVALPAGVTGMGAFVAVMVALTQRLTRGEARHLLERLDPDLRPLLEPAVASRGEAPEVFGRDELLTRVAVALGVEDPEAVTRAVFRAVQEYLRTDVFEHVMSQLPRDLQDLWVLP